MGIPSFFVRVHVSNQRAGQFGQSRNARLHSWRRYHGAATLGRTTIEFLEPLGRKAWRGHSSLHEQYAHGPPCRERYLHGSPGRGGQRCSTAGYRSDGARIDLPGSNRSLPPKRPGAPRCAASARSCRTPGDSSPPAIPRIANPSSPPWWGCPTLRHTYSVLRTYIPRLNPLRIEPRPTTRNT